MNSIQRAFAIIPVLFLAACFETPLEKADDHFAHGRFQEAAAEYRNAGDVPEARLGEARALYLAHDYADAAAVLDALLASPKTELHARAAVLRAYCSYSLYDFEDAARRVAENESAQELAGKDTDFIELKRNLADKRGQLFQADELLNLGQFDTAAEIALSAHRANPASPHRFWLLATWAKARSSTEGNFTSSESKLILDALRPLDENAALDLRPIDEIAQAFFQARAFEPAALIWTEAERIAGDWRNVEQDTVDLRWQQHEWIYFKKDLRDVYRRSYGYRSLVWRARAARAAGDVARADRLYEEVLKVPRTGQEEYFAPEARLFLAQQKIDRNQIAGLEEFLMTDTWVYSPAQFYEATRLLANARASS